MHNLVLHPVLALALQTPPAPDTGGASNELVGALMGLLLGVIQLIIGLSMAAFAINKGCAIGGKMLEGMNIWAKGALEKGEPIKVVDDQWRMPNLAEDLADGCIRIAKRHSTGICHLSGPDGMSIL